MDNNAPCHRGVLIDDFLETENIQHMSWPANSPDLNPIEHVWDMLGRQIAALSQPPRSVTEPEESSPRSLELFEPTTHSSFHSKYGAVMSGLIITDKCIFQWCQRAVSYNYGGNVAGPIKENVESLEKDEEEFLVAK
ncbi:transposable element Tcb2 transposase [Trichonephila clavipes]|nr:transposable element Tcb2 transposase [Trichonephila clavipes]